MTEKVATICLCGGGRIGTVHLRDLLSMNRVRVVAIAEVFEPRRKEMANEAHCKGYATFDDALNDKTNPFQGVVICTPTATHYEIIIRALNSKISVFCEKPISLDIKQVDECYNLAKKLDVPLLCGFQRRFDPSFYKLRTSVKNGDIGKIHVIRTTSRDHPLPSFEFLKISGGVFHDCGSHDIDMQRWITGEDPYEVFATGTAFIPEIKQMNDFDTVAMLLKFPSGAIGMIDLDRTCAYGYDQRIEVHAEKGNLKAENKYKTSVVLANKSGTLHDTVNHTFTDRYPEAYRAEIDHFLDLLFGIEKTPRLSHEDVRRTALVADACQKSAETGKSIQLVYN